MKILKLSTNKGGGATIAAERQARALRLVGHEVKHLTVHQDWTVQKSLLSEDDQWTYVKPQMSAFIKTDLLFQNYIEGNRTEVSNTYMSLWKIQSEFDNLIYEYIVAEQFDIIHFHWVSNLISSRLLSKIKTLNVSVVITGHDMNHFTGACHYDAGCGKHSLDCSECPHLEVDPFLLIASSHFEKKKSIEDLKPKYIFPSDWLNAEFEKSSIGRMLGKNSSTVIRNCLDTDYFSPADEAERKKLRKKLGFMEDEITVVSGAENNHEIRKGFNFFNETVKKINTLKFGNNRYQKIRFVAFGGGDHVVECSHPEVSYCHLGVLDESEVRDLFRAADLLAFTSIEENFANIILEALMCGCPVVGFELGGIPDIVANDINGHLVKNISEEAYATSVAKILLPEEMSHIKQSTLLWRKEKADNYSQKNIAIKLLSFYKEEGIE